MSTQEEHTGFDQDTPPEPMPGTPEAAQAVAVEREVEFRPGEDNDVGTATEEFQVGSFEAQEAAHTTGHRVTADEEDPYGGNVEDDEEEDVIEILEPKSATKEWKLGPQRDLTYYQRPLSFIAKMQWFSLLGGLLDKAMTGNNAFSLVDVLQSPTIQDAIQSQAAGKRKRKKGEFNFADLQDVDMFLRVFGKLIAHSSDFLTDSLLIWLYVPSHEREPLKEMLEGPEEEGGLSDDQGMEMIEIFIDQNWDAVTGFFTERIGNLQKRVASRQELRRRAHRG